MTYSREVSSVNFVASFLGPEGGSQNATLVVLVVVISSLRLS